MEHITENTVVISGVMLHVSGDDAVVELEIDGMWYEIVRCNMSGPFSHIVEPAGIVRCMETGKPCES